jgi:formylmethanofuran dehydrogenase subunit C
VFKIFGRKSKSKVIDLLEIELQEQVDCLCDFTYNFHWQHNGEKLDPSWKVPGNKLTYGELVEHLQIGGDIIIRGNVGHRLCSSMGTKLVYFGGDGRDISVGDVYVDGNVDTRMGISMTRGHIYVSGHVAEPMGNLLEVKSDVKGYRKFRSITDIVSNGLNEDKPINFELIGNKLIINDKTVKDTIGARMNTEAEIIVHGDVDLSTGILMRKGLVRVNGNAGKNTGALLNGGVVIINGNTDDFTGIDMIKGQIIVTGDAGKFMAANKKEGVLMVHEGRPIPPTDVKNLEPSEQQQLIGYGFNPQDFLKFE